MRAIFIIFTLGLLTSPAQLKCIKTMFGAVCRQDQDCHLQDEYHLYCNRTTVPNTCAFNEKVYIGHVYENWDCPGPQFAAVPWGNPVPSTLASFGLDCMRLCLHVTTCFGISISRGGCYLKNDACFETQNLVASPGSVIGVLMVVREDYHCGCHYPFSRQRVNGSVSEWYPQCPASHIKKSRYGCCSRKGLCQPC